jgi:diadenosine tetraphosphate (Ap4A) HIT family hydrolase/5-methylcytosine-specific restriction endonuclease McrA
MSYIALRDFLEERMQMSHVYQPVMLLTLLRHNGVATKREIAEAILHHDQSQLEYYDQIVSGMVGRVLRKHAVVTWSDGHFRLVGFDALKSSEIAALTGLCERKLADYLSKRGDRIWEHRNRTLRALSGTLRYQVLKDARFRCALCGAPAEEKALEVDHIRPRKHGGTDELSNLQALCYSCNAMKRDRDATDFRINRTLYDERSRGCLFCEIPQQDILHSNQLAGCLLDRFPVTPLHSLVFPKRHVENYFSLTPAERNACEFLLVARQKEIMEQDGLVCGFNIGINNGGVAGQTIPHVHIHLIPRRENDVQDPRGGIRNVIPGKGPY